MDSMRRGRKWNIFSFSVPKHSVTYNLAPDNSFRHIPHQFSSDSQAIALIWNNLIFNAPLSWDDVLGALPPSSTFLVPETPKITPYYSPQPIWFFRDDERSYTPFF